jgi:signal transduction histidine kinase
METAAPRVPTVLVVDDDARSREIVRANLPAEWRLVEACSAAEAEAAFEAEPMDLILLDVILPDVDGLTLCRRIKARAGSGPLLPVLLLTVLGDQDDRNAGLAAGADDFLSKPVDPRELRLRAKAFLRLRAQDQIIRSQLAALRELDALKEDLVSLVVHDLRNPLASVISLLSVLRDEAREPVVREDLESAHAAALRVRELLEEVLQVRRIEEGGLVPLREPTDLSALARDAIRVVAGAARAAGVQLLAPPGEGPIVTVDPGLVRRALENLLTNAVRHSPGRGQVEVTIRSAGKGFAVAVADRGPGVPDPQKGGLFEKFSVVQGTGGSTPRRGYGLGLHLVKLVATAHGGGVTVRDREGGGAVFELLLPG